ncbi:MAG: redoxin domain-containing protein [Bacteroidales bacterium]|nr:redoxin domain-containing protein [Bacteroidales bacterium]
MMKYFLLFFLSISAATLMAGEVKVIGKSTEYAGAELLFYKYSDRITMLKEEVFKIQVDKSGNFSVGFQVKRPEYVFMEEGLYHAYFYVEPGCTYELILPEKTEKTPADKLNPFFDYIPVHIGIKGMQKQDLNYLILDFDYFYDQYIDESLFDLYTKGMDSDVDTFINEINQHFAYAKNPFFDAYKKYRYAGLRYLAYQRNRPEISFRNYTYDSVWYENPAYMDLFNELYKDFFDNLLNDKILGEILGARLFYEVHKGHSIANIKKVFAILVELRNDQLRELVILKGIHDAFYNVNYAWAPLLLTLDSLCIVTKYPEHRLIGQNIADKVLSMSPGTVAPPFVFSDSAGNTVKLSDYRNEFVYLNFVNSQSYTSQQQLPLLQTLYNKHSRYFKIVTVVTDENIEEAKSYFSRYDYPWDIIYTGGDQQVIDYYKIKTFPAYFLVGPSGILMMSPAPGPLEGFEKAFFGLIEEK